MGTQIRRNHIAAVLALISLLLLIPAYSLPFMAISSMSGRDSYSLLKSVDALVQENQLFLAGIIFFFSVVFPIFKLLVLLATITTFWRFSDSTRHGLKKVVTFTGKFSLLDVMVCAVLVVAFKSNDMISFKLLPGIWLFLAAIIVSIAAGLFMDTSRLEPEKVTREIQSTPFRPMGPTPGRPRWIWPLLSVIGAMLVAGLLLLVIPLKQPINQATLLKKQELSVSLWPTLDKPDYYLTIRTNNGREIPTRYYENTPIGNGLIYRLSPVPLKDIMEITVWDHNLISDEALDRMNVTNRENAGMYYEVILDGPKSSVRTIGLVLTLIGGVLLFLGLIREVTRSVI